VPIFQGRLLENFPQMGLSWFALFNYPALENPSNWRSQSQTIFNAPIRLLLTSHYP
jgi:hypothetical protein